MMYDEYDAHSAGLLMIFLGVCMNGGWVCFIFDRLLGENNSRDAAILYYNSLPALSTPDHKMDLYHRP
jgi:hypothetical protein